MAFTLYSIVPNYGLIAHSIIECRVNRMPFYLRTSNRNRERAQKRQLPKPGRETRRKKSGAESKWHFNYNGRLITAIAHHEPSFSRNSRIIRASGSRRGESPISLRTPLTPSKTPRRFPESLVLQPLASPSTYTRAQRRLSQSFSRAGFHSLEISRSQYALSTPYNQQRLIPSRLFAYVSHDEQGDETHWWLQAVIRELLQDASCIRNTRNDFIYFG